MPPSTSQSSSQPPTTPQRGYHICFHTRRRYFYLCQAQHSRPALGVRYTTRDANYLFRAAYLGSGGAGYGNTTNGRLKRTVRTICQGWVIWGACGFSFMSILFWWCEWTQYTFRTKHAISSSASGVDQWNVAFYEEGGKN